MQKESLILALFILAVVICLGLTLIPKLNSFVSDTAKKIGTERVRIEQAAKA